MPALSDRLLAAMKRWRDLLIRAESKPAATKKLMWLRRLDDRTLDDIGLPRHELERLIENAHMDSDSER